MDKGIKQVVVLLAHPDIKSSQANKALMDAIKELEEVAVYNLYEMRPEDAFNVDSWSKIISQASAIVFQFPLYWMSAPSLLKKWQDEVFTYLAKTPAVAGKALLVAVTTGSEYSAYRSGGRNNFTIDELLRPYQGSAIHAGMVWQTPVVAYGMGTADAGKNIAEGVNNYKVKKAIGNSSHNIFNGKLSNKLLSLPNTIRISATTEQKTIDNQNIAVDDFVNPSFPSLKNATEK